jgi:hypothetical protein
MSSIEPEPPENALQMNQDQSKVNPCHTDSEMRKNRRVRAQWKHQNWQATAQNNCCKLVEVEAMIRTELVVESEGAAEEFLIEIMAVVGRGLDGRLTQKKDVDRRNPTQT